MTTFALREKVLSYGPDRSELPPLNPKSPHKANNSKTVVLEIQKARTAVMEMIQSETNGHNRGNQEFESQLNLTEHEFNPKIQALERQNNFSKKQFANIMQQLTTIEGSVVQNLKNTQEDTRLLFEQQIKQDSISKLSPIQEEQKLQMSKIQKLTESVVTFLSQNSDTIREVSKDSESLEAKINAYNKHTVSVLNDLQPKVSLAQSKQATLESNAEEFLRMVANQHDMSNSGKSLMDKIKNIEEDVIPHSLAQMSDDSLALISGKTTELDRRIFEIEARTTSHQGVVVMASQQQKQHDDQVEQMSRKTMELDASLKNDEDEIVGKLNILEKQLANLKKKLNGQIQAQLSDSKDENNFNEEDFKDSVTRLSDLSRKDIETLSSDWNGFIRDNGKAQQFVDEKIGSSVNLVSDESNLIERVKAVEARVKWCMNRLDVWARDDAKKARAGFNDELAILKQIDEIEGKLDELENSEEKVDGQKAVPKSKPEKAKINDIGKPPEEKANESEKGDGKDYKIDKSLTLTYPDDAEEFIPLRKEKEDEERAAKKLAFLKEQAAKREERRNINFDDDFVDENDENKEPKIKERSLGNAMKTAAAALADETEDDEPPKEEDDEKPKKKKRSKKQRSKPKDEEEEDKKDDQKDDKTDDDQKDDQKGNKSEEEDDNEKEKNSLKGAMQNAIGLVDDDDDNENNGDREDKKDEDDNKDENENKEEEEEDKEKKSKKRHHRKHRSKKETDNEAADE